MISAGRVAWVADLTDCLLKSRNFFSHDHIWKGMHEVIGGTLVAWLVRNFGLSNS